LLSRKPPPRPIRIYAQIELLLRRRAMGDETKRVKLIIESKIKKDRPISAVLIAEMFQRLQNIIYYIVDDLEGNPPRRAGDFPNSVKEKAELVITGMRIGSAEAELMLSDSQTGLPGGGTLGEKAISIANGIIRKVSDEDISLGLSNAIKNGLRQERVIHEFEAIWPDEQSKYNITLGLGKKNEIPLNPSHRHILRDLLPKPPENVEKSVTGRLMEVRVDQRRSFQIDTVEGLVTCSYAPDLENKVVENIGRIVRIRGIMALEKGGKYTLSLDNEKSLEDLKMLPLTRVKIRGKSLDLKEPILLEVSYEDDRYWVSSDKFHLRVFGPNLKAAIEDLNEEIEILWEDYVEVGLGELSEDALDFRRELILAFGGEKANANA
jgi:hypothetical protein